MKPSVLGFCCFGKMLTKSNLREIGLISAYSGKSGQELVQLLRGSALYLLAPRDFLSYFLIHPRTTMGPSHINYY